MQTQEEEVGDGKRHSFRDPQNFPLRSRGVEGQAAGEKLERNSQACPDVSKMKLAMFSRVCITVSISIKVYFPAVVTGISTGRR